MLSAILAIIIVNTCQKLFMRATGTDVMVYSLRKKIIWYVLVGVILFSCIGI